MKPFPALSNLHAPGLSLSRKLLQSKNRRGSALLLVLAFLLLLTGLVLFFLSRSLLERQVSDSSANQTKAQILAQNALDLIIGDLKQEIVKTSTVVPVGKTTIYEPIFDPKNSSATVMMPIGNAPASIPNLIRTSTRSDPAALTALGLSTRASPVNSTADASANGRSVALARWNLHGLIPRLNTGATEDPTPVSAFNPPDWVMVTRTGPQVLSSWNNSYANAAVGNGNFVTGRYSYAVYDEGGLIDANVAGFPGNLTALQVGGKGSLAFADLTQVPNPTATTTLSANQVNQLVGWRNYATAQPSGSLLAGYTFDSSSAANYFNYVVPASGSPPTFLTTNPVVAAPSRTDQTFTSRQALISYQRAMGLSADVLQYLGTFTRELNQPCFSPYVTPDQTFSGSPKVTYPDALNPIVQEIAVNNSSSPSDGQLLVQQRFALDHLGLFANPSANASDIQKYFGLAQLDAHTWNYTNLRGDGTVNTLAEVAAISPPRAPDFFELLQAAVLNGSFYDGVCNNSHSPPMNSFAWDPAMVMQMGANLISQYQSNNFPLTIQLGSGVNPQLVSGSGDLPYFSEILLWPYRPESSDPYRSELDGYWMFEFWNPQQNTSTVPGPTQLRMVFTTPPSGTYLGANQVPVPAAPASNPLSPPELLNPPYYVVFNNSAVFREPTILSSQEVTTTGTSPQWVTISPPADDTSGDSPRSGFLCGSLAAVPDSDYANSHGLPTTLNGQQLSRYLYAYSGGSNVASVEMEFLDPSTNTWYPYQGQPQPQNPPVPSSTAVNLWTYENQLYDDLPGGQSIPAQTATNIAYTTFNYYAVRSLQLVDPRFPLAIAAQATPNGTACPGGMGLGILASSYEQIGPSGYIAPYNGGAWPPNCYPALYDANTTGGVTPTYLTDADGVTRPGDGALGTSLSSASSPYVSGKTEGRPIILHRPFRSIAEMGYAFRGVGSWKTINFFSSTSADAGLLDYFSLEDAPMLAGKVNLNTRQPIALQAILSGAYREESAGDCLTATDASNLANAIVTHTATAPLRSRADLIRGLLADSSVTAAIDNIQGTSPQSPAPDTIKGRREAVIRALADVGTTRTWNLMIDIVAQSGRYAPNATQLTQFRVQGEKHYWLHVAIDRYTGQVIDQQLEAVNE